MHSTHVPEWGIPPASMVVKKLEIRHVNNLLVWTDTPILYFLAMTIEERMLFTIKSEKIVGGRLVENIGNWAFIGNLGGYCGGSLIGDTWFLTAGHCCASTPLGKKVYFGVLNPWEDRKRVERRVVEYELHPDFIRETLKQDMCLMRLDQPLDYSGSIKPICLNENELKKNEPVFVAGWGLTEEGGSQTGISQTFFVRFSLQFLIIF